MKIRNDNCDRMFSLLVRAQAGGRCERCGRAGRLECSHFHGRRKRSTRWDFGNCAALCYSCHRRFTENPAEHVEWFRKRLGQKRFDALTLRANLGRAPDRALVSLALKAEMERMGL